MKYQGFISSVVSFSFGVALTVSILIYGRNKANTGNTISSVNVNHMHTHSVFHYVLNPVPINRATGRAVPNMGRNGAVSPPHINNWRQPPHINNLPPNSANGSLGGYYQNTRIQQNQ